MGLQVDRTEAEDGTIILTLAPRGEDRAFEVDLLDSAAVEAALAAEARAGHTRMVVDLGQAGYMHSRAFWAIVRAAERCLEAGGRLIVARASPYLRRLIDLTSAAESVHVADTVDQACRSLRAP
jgi:anti-anti-sigma factor